MHTSDFLVSITTENATERGRNGWDRGKAWNRFSQEMLKRMDVSRSERDELRSVYYDAFDDAKANPF